MAVVFYLLVNGHGRGSRPRTYKDQSVLGEQENQPNFVLLLGFYNVPRLTPINRFALFLEKNVRELETEHRRASEFAFFVEETWGNRKQRNSWSPLVDMCNLGMLLGASRGPPGGLPGPS